MGVEGGELLPGLPDEIALECLIRLHHSAHPVSSQVCRRWRELIRSRDFYYYRKKLGLTCGAACLIQTIPGEFLPKSASQPRYFLSLFDPVRRRWERIDPVPEYPKGLPVFCQIVSTEGKVIVMGGWDPSSTKAVRDVFMYDFTSRKWSKCAGLPSARSFFAAGVADGKVIIAGGHDEGKNALSSAWIFDINANEWRELNRMNEERDECEGIVIGSQFWVVSGYETESQGTFKDSAEFYDGASWKLVPGAWKASQCPRSCVGLGLTSWADSDPAIRVGSCAIEIGDWVFLSGSSSEGAQRSFLLLDRRRWKIENIHIVPDDGFSGCVQSGCSVEI